MNCSRPPHWLAGFPKPKPVRPRVRPCPELPHRASDFILGFWLAFALSPLVVKTAAGAGPANVASLEAELLAQVNQVRSEHHLIPLVRRSDLDRVAQAHSSDMAQRGYFSHQSPEGEEPGRPAPTIRSQRHAPRGRKPREDDPIESECPDRQKLASIHRITGATCSLQP